MRAWPDALSVPERACTRLNSSTMPCGVFCVSSWPVTESSAVLPAWSLPTLRIALFTSKHSSLAWLMEKPVRVCSERTSSGKLSPWADKVVSPETLPARMARRLNAASALLTSMFFGFKVPFKRSDSWPAAGACSCTSPCAVPPPTLM